MPAQSALGSTKINELTLSRMLSQQQSCSGGWPSILMLVLQTLVQGCLSRAGTLVTLKLFGTKWAHAVIC